jgi:hypothetical protein
MKKAIAVLAVALFGTGAMGVGFVACGSGSGNGSGSDGGNNDGTVGDGNGGPDGQPGDGHGGDGASSSSSSGGGDGGGVFHGDGGCFVLGTACSANGDCCSNDCSNKVCSFPPCTGDNQACTTNGQCCGGNCTGGTCAPLNGPGGCSTFGNPCGGTTPDGGAEPACCSGNCVAGKCQPSSFCGQVGEACASGVDCCSGICTKQGTSSLGVCGSAPTSSANCNLTDGMLCAGTTADGGIVLQEGGIPSCGGACCSRSCAPWGPTGVLICQPASGCHLVGDLCTNDNECCGSAAFPGDAGGPQSQGGYATCTGAGEAGVGVCRNPTGCKPNGDVCRLSNIQCNSSCDCCSGNCHADTCKQDNLGIPRCSVATCLDAGGACATSADCCNGNPCVPGPGGVLQCYGYQCVPSCGTCSNTADCCPGFNCLNGVCDPCGGGPPPDGGPPPPPADGGPPPLPDGGCAGYGQLCTTTADCCNGVPCNVTPTGMRCEFPVQ